MSWFVRTPTHKLAEKNLLPFLLTLCGAEVFGTTQIGLFCGCFCAPRKYYCKGRKMKTIKFISLLKWNLHLLILINEPKAKQLMRFQLTFCEIFLFLDTEK